MPQMKQISFAVALCVTALTASPAVAQTSKDSGLQLVSAQLQGSKSDRKLVGVVANKSNNVYAKAEIKFKVFEGGADSKEKDDSTSDLMPGANWNFRMNVSKEVTRFELSSLSGVTKGSESADKDDDGDKDNDGKKDKNDKD